MNSLASAGFPYPWFHLYIEQTKQDKKLLLEKKELSSPMPAKKKWYALHRWRVIPLKRRTRTFLGRSLFQIEILFVVALFLGKGAAINVKKQAADGTDNCKDRSQYVIYLSKEGNDIRNKIQRVDHIQAE